MLCYDDHILNMLFYHKYVNCLLRNNAKTKISCKNATFHKNFSRHTVGANYFCSLAFTERSYGLSKIIKQKTNNKPRQTFKEICRSWSYLIISLIFFLHSSQEPSTKASLYNLNAKLSFMNIITTLFFSFIFLILLYFNLLTDVWSVRIISSSKNSVVRIHSETPYVVEYNLYFFDQIKKRERNNLKKATKVINENIYIGNQSLYNAIQKIKPAIPITPNTHHMVNNITFAAPCK